MVSRLAKNFFNTGFLSAAIFISVAPALLADGRLIIPKSTFCARVVRGIGESTAAREPRESSLSAAIHAFLMTANGSKTRPGTQGPQIADLRQRIVTELSQLPGNARSAILQSLAFHRDSRLKTAVPAQSLIQEIKSIDPTAILPDAEESLGNDSLVAEVQAMMLYAKTVGLAAWHAEKNESVKKIRVDLHQRFFSLGREDQALIVRIFGKIIENPENSETQIAIAMSELQDIKNAALEMTQTHLPDSATHEAGVQVLKVLKDFIVTKPYPPQPDSKVAPGLHVTASSSPYIFAK